MSDEVNWMADDWFARCHAYNLTDEFRAWWIAEYGPPSSYPQEDDEQHEYWTRCAFAWIGWQAASMRGVTI